MNIRPLPLEGWEVRAILAGSKTRFITPLVPQPMDREGIRRWQCLEDSRLKLEMTPLAFEDYAPARLVGRCPYGQPGDLRWVQESAAHGPSYGCGSEFIFQADDASAGPVKWEPSTQLPRRASRLTLEIASVQLLRFSKVRMLDFQGEASWKLLDEEGKYRGCTAKEAFATVFDRSRHYGVATTDDPLLWVIRFEAIQENIDKFLESEAQGRAA